MLVLMTAELGGFHHHRIVGCAILDQNNINSVTKSVLHLLYSPPLCLNIHADSIHKILSAFSLLYICVIQG